MKLKYNYSVVIFCVAFLLQSCSSNEEVRTPFSAIEKNEDFIKSNHKFAFETFKKIAQDETEENFMISSVSLSLALGMAYNGAENDTKNAFEETLNYTEFLPTETNNLNKEIIYHLSDNSQGSLFEIANSIWTEKTFAVKEDFIKINKEFYDAEVQSVDFSDPNSLQRINDWVNTKTRKKIPKILEELNPNLKMILLNALYFKSDWKYTFKEENTQELPFYGETSTDNVQMMKFTNDLSFYQNDHFESIKLPYKNDKFSMTIFLPKENSTTLAITNLLTIENWQHWNENYFTIPVDLEMPKFKFSYEKKLNNPLSDIGLSVAFTDAANFAGMSDSPLKISFIIQKTFIEVDEKGTEAAAVTAIGMELTNIGSSNRIVRLNKPFLYVITEKETGSICFLGKLGMPKNEE
ncbi:MULTISPECIES: serpin family protein [unclassified Polaribacter]|uniref:serpin family protein n=1 Tax=unclassified Polaribacter TaxID=196858 RepID=UPI0011BEC171|nr:MULTISPECIES: serpin family protein [unclassified Polaribacter]TXD53473.1 serpin family protein [Polaribacter sp. IC063]TXD57712.1 serpin family protein [Polaribacter sp. IC066]